jgi:hypothetical protein
MQNSVNIKDFETLIRRHANQSAVDQALKDYEAWKSTLKGNEKEVTHLLYFLKAVEERSGNKTIKNNHQVSHMILSKAEVPNMERRQQTETSYLTLLHKKISKDYQIDMEFQDPKGSKVKKSVTELTM